MSFPSPYPWRQDFAVRRMIRDANDAPIAQTWSSDSADKAYANAALIVQAVNYCVSLTRSDVSPIPEGWQLVPKEPTQHMICEGGYAVQHCCDVSMAAANGAWKAMLAAAPSHPGPTCAETVPEPKERNV